MRSVPAPKLVPFDMPALGGPVFIRRLRMSENEAIRSECEGKPADTFVRLLLERSVVEEDGSPVLDGAGWDALSADYTDQVLALIQAVTKANGNVEEAAKN